MRKTLDRVVKSMCTVNTLSSLSVADLHRMQLEAPYATIFTLLHILHPDSYDVVKTRWERINVHASNLLWWQYVELSLSEASKLKTAGGIEEEAVIEATENETSTTVIVEAKTLESKDTQSIEKTTDVELTETGIPIALSSSLAKIKQSLNAPLVKERVFVDLEPYHTIDYFASQGIKIDTTVDPKDKLGKQLKSFTDWLKTMKRIGPTPANLSIDIALEKEVVHHAASSITKDEIITETMAEVLAKQGKIDKAIEVYDQLRLINPDKNAYFASKIQQLKV